jgi:YggT family protein
VYILGYLLIALAKILNGLLWAYMWVIIIRALLSWVRPDPYNPIVRFIYGLVDPISYRISRIIPTRAGMIDFAPFILLVVVIFLQAFLVPVIQTTGVRLLP